MPSFGIWHLATDGDSQCKVHFVTILHNIKCWILLHHIFLPTMKKNRMFFLGSLDQKCRSQPFQIPVWILDTSLKAQPHHDKSPFRELERSYVWFFWFSPQVILSMHYPGWSVCLTIMRQHFFLRHIDSTYVRKSLHWQIFASQSHNRGWLKEVGTCVITITLIGIGTRTLAFTWLKETYWQGNSWNRNHSFPSQKKSVWTPWQPGWLSQWQQCVKIVLERFIRWKNISIKTSQSVSRWLHT